MRLKIAPTINIGKERAEDQPTTGPDIEAQIGTHHDAAPTDLYLGFTTGPTIEGTQG